MKKRGKTTLQQQLDDAAIFASAWRGFKARVPLLNKDGIPIVMGKFLDINPVDGGVDP